MLINMIPLFTHPLKKNKFSLLLGMLVFAFLGRVNAQSPATINVSECATSTTLTASNIPSGYSGLTWNNGSTASSLTANSSGAYWWQVTGTNVVTNGDFTSGNTGFTSAYTFMAKTGTPSALYAEGTYSVYTDPSALHGSFTSFADHTGNSPANKRNMLIVNGASTANVIVWTQNITVVANTDYVFSTWVASTTSGSPAQLQFSINGIPLGSTINASPTTGNWQYFTTTWNSGSNSGSMPIALVNQNTAASGNDFAVDDIVFAPVYRQNINVTLNPIPVITLNATALGCETYNLINTIISYDAATYTYVFKDSGGNVIANPSAIVQSGVYTITAQNKVTGCTSLPKQTTITIDPNPQKPGITPL